MTGTDAERSGVATTSDQAGGWALAPLLVLDQLETYLDAQGLGSGPITWRRIGDGHSNITFSIERGEAALVLRRGPRPPFPPSAHNMVREARIQRALSDGGYPTPTIVTICEDTEILGVPFYLMEFVDGVVMTDRVPPGAESDDVRHAMATTAVDSLVSLHAVDLHGDLGTFARPEGYLSRQVDRFAGLWPMNTRRSLPLVDQLATWLRANLPETRKHSVVHGDYRLGNLMFDRTRPHLLAAVMDWEMATLGDPLADLGYFTATYSDNAFPATCMELSPTTRLPGFPGRGYIRDYYSDATGLDLSALPWYEALALWKAAIFSEAIYTRWLDGERPGDAFGPTLERGVPELLDCARAAADSLP